MVLSALFNNTVGRKWKTRAQSQKRALATLEATIVARRKKTDFEVNMGEFGVQLHLPTTLWKLPCQAEGPSTDSRNSS